jgi:hypothetical protein
MIDEDINNHFKVSNDPNLIRWNPTVSIQLVLAQLEALYGKHGDQLMWNKDKLFIANFLPINASELLSHCVEQCQEVTIIARNPYTPMQLIANTVHLLLQSRIFPIKEFEDWGVSPNKMWLALKTFIHGVYAWHLVAVELWSTLVQQGYVPAQNMYNILGTSGNDTNNKLTVVTVTQTTAAATTGSTLANTYATPVPAPTDPHIASAINSLAANYQALYQHIVPLLQQMAAMSFNTQPPTPRRMFTAPHLTPFNVPPIQQLTILPSHISRQGVSTTDAEDRAQGDMCADTDSIGAAKDVLLLLITWLLAAVDSKVAWALTTCSHRRAVFRL